MALIDKETIRAKIERYKQEAAIARFDNAGENADYFQGKVDLCNDLTHILDTLPEQPAGDGLEEEIARYLREECSADDEPSISDIARHFAEWGAEHLKR